VCGGSSIRETCGISALGMKFRVVPATQPETLPLPAIGSASVAASAHNPSAHRARRRSVPVVVPYLTSAYLVPHDYKVSVNPLSRRQFVATIAAAVPFLGTPRRLLAGSPACRALTFTHTHTGEHLAVEYFTSGAYVPDALAAVNHFLRDFRTGDVHRIDAGLLDLLHQLAGTTETSLPFQVISGYRSPATNEMLRHRSEGVAAGSLHMKGQAIDIRLADVPLASLYRAALEIRGGGVGYYPASDFVHVDTGRVRTW
jgi:uncharacterized protein YcbK (DUF882 family)